MSLGSIISAIVGGLLIVSLVVLNNRMLKSSANSTYDLISKDYIETINQIFTFDMQNLGYGVTGKMITQASEHSITFKSDLKNNGHVNVVTWKYDAGSPDTKTENPNDHPLYRITDGVQTTMHAGVSAFRLSYILSDNKEVFNPVHTDQIRQVRIHLVSESPYKYGGHYEKSVWDRLFTPANLHL